MIKAALRGGLGFIRSTMKSKQAQKHIVKTFVLLFRAQLKPVIQRRNSSDSSSKMHIPFTFLFDFAENSSDEMKRDREEKKRYLLRKLSFRPTVEELKSRKVRKQKGPSP